MDYKEYLKSKKWQWKRNLVLKQHGSICKICESTKQIHIHHKRYENSGGSILGRERTSDLVPLCSSCHSLWHSTHGYSPISNRIIKNIVFLLKLGGNKKDSFIVAQDIVRFNRILQKIEGERTTHQAQAFGNTALHT